MDWEPIFVDYLHAEDQSDASHDLGHFRRVYHCAKNRPLDDKIFGLDHFYVKLFKLPDLLQTIGGRCIADKRLQFLKFFVEELDENVKNTKGGALEVVKACYRAGLCEFQLFDLLDPFALNRPLSTSRFVIDHLIDVQEQFSIFITQFLDQFQEEINFH